MTRLSHGAGSPYFQIFLHPYMLTRFRKRPMSGGREMGGHFMTANKNQSNNG